MMQGYSIKECAKRLGSVLLGRPDPTVEQIFREATQIQMLAGDGVDRVGAALKAVYERVVKEPVPADLAGLIHRLPVEGPRSYRPTRGVKP